VILSLSVVRNCATVLKTVTMAETNKSVEQRYHLQPQVPQTVQLTSSNVHLYSIEMPSANDRFLVFVINVSLFDPEEDGCRACFK
jgi:hypothetical protein